MAGTGSIDVQVQRAVKPHTSTMKSQHRMQNPTHWNRNGTPTR
jgi:hypothetical protein